jgi:ABC-type multidrug transport system fused ATPase/permease subunit
MLVGLLRQYMRRHRRLVARAFLAHPQVRVLDEVTGLADSRTEVLIQHAMCGLRRDRTSFAIGQRLSTTRDADVILVMDPVELSSAAAIPS